MVRFPTEAAFRAWLESKARYPLTPVGLSRNESNCPLATFLWQERGMIGAVVRPASTPPCWWTPEMGDTYRRLPAWAVRFGRAVDEPGLKIVFAGEALMVLNA